MAWRRPGDKPLSEPVMAYLTDAHMRHSVQWLNPLAPGRCVCNIKLVIFKTAIKGILSISSKIASRWMLQALTMLTDD